MYKELFNLLTTRGKFRTNNRAFLFSMCCSCCRKSRDKVQIGSAGPDGKKYRPSKTDLYFEGKE